MPDDRPDRVSRTRFEDALAQGLGALPHGTSVPCPDVEVLAAYSDDSLGTAERGQVESHLAECLRCQAHVAALVRTELAEAHNEPPATPSWLDWRWVAPLATTAVVLLAVWAVDPTSVRDSVRPVEMAAPALEDRDEPSEAPEANELPRLAESPAVDLLQQEREVINEGEARADERDDPPSIQASPSSPAEVPVARSQESSVASPETARDTLDASPAREEVAAGAVPESVAPAERRLNDLARTTSTASALRNRAANQSVGLPILASNGPVAWRMTREGGLEQTSDGGLTWSRQLATTDAVLTSGSAPTDRVCWLVGSNGAILRTVDGGTSWSRIDAPRDADLVDVTAASEQAAVITFGDGQTFATSNGGATWTSR